MSIISAASSIFASLLQIALLLASGSYLLYLLALIAGTAAEGIALSIIANRRYPYVNAPPSRKLTRDETRSIRKNVYAMLCHKIGSVLVDSMDELILTKFVGLVAMGCYANYTMLLAAARGLVSKVFTSVVASVGNLALERDRLHVERVLHRLLFLNFWLYAWCSIAFCGLAQPFIRLWAGERYLLSDTAVLLIAVYFYAVGMRQTVLTFRDATGTFWYDRYKPLVEGMLNVALCIPLAQRFGLEGVLAGSIATTLLVPFWFEGHVLFLHVFSKGSGAYLRRQARYALLAVCTGIITYAMCCALPASGGISLLARGIVCLVVPNAIFLIALRRSDEFAYYRSLARNALRSRKA